MECGSSSRGLIALVDIVIAKRKADPGNSVLSLRRTLAAVAAAALSVAGLAVVAAAPVAAQTVSLAASSVTDTTATLTISGHTTAWYHKQTAPTAGTCSSVIAAGTDTASLTSLATGTDHTYTAYSDSTCTTANELASASFTTAGVVLSRPSLIAPEGRTATYKVSLATEPSASVTVTLSASGTSDSDITFDTDSVTTGNQTTLTFTTTNYSTAQTVTVAAAEETDATDKAYGTATITHTADSGYHSTTVDLAVSEGDNDVCQGTTAVGGSLVTSGGLVDDCNTLLAAKSMIAGTKTSLDDWSTGRAIEDWAGINTSHNRVSEFVPGFSLPRDGMLPNTIGDLTALGDIRLGNPGGTDMSGPIPDEISNLINLRTIDFGYNDFYGPIPSGLCNAKHLSWLALDYNRLSGTIPACLGNLTRLDTLWLGSNDLSGSFPTALSSLRNLRQLSLFSLGLSGSIPSSLGNLTRLEQLNIQNNNLTGSIPASLGNLTSLKSLKMWNNSLTGCVPANLISFVTAGNEEDGDKKINPQSGGNLSVCDGITISKARLSVPDGTTGTYTVRLSTAPSAPVTVMLSGMGDDDITFDTDISALGRQNTLSFTTSNWNTVKTVTVNSADDNDGSDGTVTITHTATSTDADYNNITSTVTATQADDATRIIIYDITSNSAWLHLIGRSLDTQGSTQWSWKRTEPTNTTCKRSDRARTTIRLLGLTPATDYTYKSYSDNNCTTEVASVSFTTAGIALSRPAIIAPEGRTASYSVKLATAPSTSVTVTATVSGDSDITIDTDPTMSGNQNTLTFTASNYSTAQTVTVAAAEETGATDKAYGTATVTHTADSGYHSATADLAVSEGDNDVCQGTTAVGGSLVTSGGLVDDCNTLLAAKSMLSGTSTTLANWSTASAINSWTGVAAGSRVTEINLGPQHLM